MIPDRSRGSTGRSPEPIHPAVAAGQPTLSRSSWRLCVRRERGTMQIAVGPMDVLTGPPWTVNPFDRSDDLVVISASGGQLGTSLLALALPRRLYERRPDGAGGRLHAMPESRLGFLIQWSDGGRVDWLVEPPKSVDRMIRRILGTFRRSPEVTEIHAVVPGPLADPRVSEVARAVVACWATSASGASRE